MPTVCTQHQDPATNSLLKFIIYKKKLNHDCKSTPHIGTYIHEISGDPVSYQGTFTTAILHQHMKWGVRCQYVYTCKSATQ